MTDIDGYGVEPTEVDAIVDWLVGERDPSDEDEMWFGHLSSRLALLQATTERVSGLRDDLVAGMVGASSERDVATRLNLSPARPGQLARRSKQRHQRPSGTTQTIARQTRRVAADDLDAYERAETRASELAEHRRSVAQGGKLTCTYCGRRGTRGFVILSGDHHGDAGRVSWICASRTACEKRRTNLPDSAE